jgi:hypothetical protein
MERPLVPSGDPVISAGDEDLLAFDEVDAVFAGRRGLGAVGADVGAGACLGEAHGARPLAAEHLGQDEVLHVLGAVVLDEGGGAAGEAGEHREGDAGAGEDLAHGDVEAVRHAEAAVLGVGGERAPAAVAVGVPGGLEGGRGGDVAVAVEGAAQAVRVDVDGGDGLGGDAVALVEHGVEGVAVELGVGGEALELAHDVEVLMQGEADVAQVGGEGGRAHGASEGCERCAE